MAGGKSTRFDFDKINCKCREKQLLPLGNKHLIEYVIDAILASKYVNRLIVAVSPFTPNTKSIIEKKRPLIELIETSGIDYHFDLPFIIKKLKLGITATIVADLPLIKPDFIDEIIEQYFFLNKPALSVMIDAESFTQHGLKPTITIQSKNGQKSLVPLGINVIDGRLIEQSILDEAIFISERLELMYNVNTVDDYFRLIKDFNKKKIKI